MKRHREGNWDDYDFMLFILKKTSETKNRKAHEDAHEIMRFFFDKVSHVIICAG